MLSDESAAAYKRKPIMTLAERVAVIEACRYVDEVIADAPLRLTQAFLDEHDLALVVHGDDLDARGRSGRVRARGGRRAAATRAAQRRLHDGPDRPGAAPALGALRLRPDSPRERSPCLIVRPDVVPVFSKIRS